MIPNELCFGQRIDPELGILEPWYTHGALDKIKSWDLSNKKVVEYGGGASTLWWAMRAAKVYSVDHNSEWVTKVNGWLDQYSVLEKATILFVPTHEGDVSDNRDLYVKRVDCFDAIDIAIVDGVHRYECAEYLIKEVKPRILIVDNHNQDYVFICPALDELTKGFHMERFVQPDHTDHSGNPWATAIFYL